MRAPPLPVPLEPSLPSQLRSPLSRIRSLSGKPRSGPGAVQGPSCGVVPRAPLVLESASSQLLFWKPDRWGTSGAFPSGVVTELAVWLGRKEKKRCLGNLVSSLPPVQHPTPLPPPQPSLPAFLGMGEGPERPEDRRVPGSHRPPTSPQLWVCQDFLRRRSSEEGREGARDSLSARDFLPPFSSPNYSGRPNTKDPSGPGCSRTCSTPAPL